MAVVEVFVLLEMVSFLLEFMRMPASSYKPIVSC